MTKTGVNTGKIFEELFNTVLPMKGYRILEKKEYQSFMPLSISGGKHLPDKVIETPDNRWLILSKKWQETSGTAEQKVPFEVIKLIDAIKSSDHRFPYAYLILGGEGWTPKLKEFYLKGGLNQYINGYNLVRIVNSDQFLTLVNRNKL
jgi:hypothetical protein